MNTKFTEPLAVIEIFPGLYTLYFKRLMKNKHSVQKALARKV